MLRLAALVAVLAGCKVTGTFTCETSDQCRLGGVLGTCEQNGFCSFDDSSCASGSRYDSLAGGGLAGVCVGEEPGTDAMVDGPPGCTLWNAHYVDACALPAPPGSIHLDAAGSPYKYDTTTGGGSLTDQLGQTIAVTSTVLSQASGDAAVWTVADLELAAGVELDVVGTKPLIIAAWDHISVVGTIDVGSHRGVRIGAGPNPVGCDSAMVGTDGASGTSGGGGGAFRGNGGNGGLGDANAVAPAMPLPGGVGGNSRTAPRTAMGGCNGARSGSDTNNNTFAPGGSAGGGLALTAQFSIIVSGKLLAGGAGGDGDISTTASYGGGGGGSGGMIGLDSATVDVSNSVLAANGGAGGAGGNIAGTGTGGADGGPNGMAAIGGTGVAAQGSNGGNGSSQGTFDGATVTDNTPVGGGGGGGGGAGYIIVYSPSLTSTGATISPPILPGT